MITELVKMDVDALASRWWVLVVRGIAAIVFGAMAIAWPGISLLALVYLWGAYAMADGFTGIALAVQAGQAKQRWGWFLFEGLVSIGAGLGTLFMPGITAFALLTLIALWAVMTGVMKIATAIELRNVVKGEWLLGLSGLLSIAFGTFMLFFPGAGALAVLAVIATFAIFSGVLQTAVGIRVHRLATHPMTPRHA